jgi:hypothetical protein
MTMRRQQSSSSAAGLVMLVLIAASVSKHNKHLRALSTSVGAMTRTIMCVVAAISITATCSPLPETETEFDMRFSATLEAIFATTLSSSTAIFPNLNQAYAFADQRLPPEQEPCAYQYAKNEKADIKTNRAPIGQIETEWTGIEARMRSKNLKTASGTH